MTDRSHLVEAMKAATVQIVAKGGVHRVAIVVAELRGGGAERVAVHLATALRQLGVTTEIVCIRRPGVLAEDAQAAGVPVVALNSLRGYDVGAILALRRELRRFHPDVINVHDRASLPYVVMANRMGDRCAIVFSAHGLLMRDSIRPRLRDRLSAWGVQAVTAVSEPAAKEYKRLLGWGGKTTIIDNGVPPIARDQKLRRQVRSQLGVDDDVFVYLAVGNAKPEKGFEDLIRAAAALRDAAGNRRFVVWIAGGVSDEPYQQSLNDLQRGLSMDGAVRFLGFRRDTVGLYSAADAFVLSSRKEGLPMVLLESMSAGLPVVATNVGAVSTVVVDGKNGLLVAPADPPKLAKAMLCLLRDGALCGRLGQAAACEARNRYGLERMAGEYLTVYQQASREHALSRPRVDGRPRVLMLGPMPPLTGGMATVITNIMESCLCEQFNMAALNNGKTTPPNRPLIQGIMSQVKLLGRLMSMLSRNRIGIVHLHTCEYLGFWRDCLHALVAGRMGCRIVWHIHGARFDQWAKTRSAFGRAVIRVAFERAAAVIVLSEDWRRRLLEFAPRATWRVIANGIPVPSSPPTLLVGPTRFLFLGDWTQRKGVADLVMATEKAVREHGFTGIVALAGFEKEPGQRARLEHLVERSGCASQIEILGLVSGKAKDDAMAAAHCIVLPSYGEGLPMAILEGMAYGRPIIATRVGAVPEVITDGREGFLIEPGDISALAERMARLSADTDLACQMGAAARERVERDYTLSVMVKRIGEVYSEVCQDGNAPASMEQK